MTEGELLVAAPGPPAPDDRVTFLDRGYGDAAVRGRVEALLAGE